MSAFCTRWQLICCLLLAPFVGLSSASGQSFQAQVDASDATYFANKLTITGRVVDEAGRPIRNAYIKTFAWGENAGNNNRRSLSNARGRFIFENVDRRAALIRVSRKGYYTEVLPVDLQRPAGDARYFVGKIKLYKKQRGRVRFIFGGDTMMGRRYFDQDNDGEWGESEDILQRETIATDSKSLFKFVRQSLVSDDHTVVNLETPVTNNPLTPHPSKTYSFYTRPESVEALSTVGINSVSLGNNHVYDYLEAGLTDTLAALTESPVRWFGAGMSDTAARASRTRININKIRFSLQGFSQLTERAQGDVMLEIVAHDAPNAKGGALELNDTTLQNFLSTEEAVNRFTIPMLHGGSEYASTQSNAMRNYFKLAIENGADLVVAHHPHVPHGISHYNAGKGPRWIFGSLGNFVFDQNVYETFQSYLTMVDIQHTSVGPRVKRVQLLPYRIDNYAPRFLAGDGLTRMARKIGHLSTLEGDREDGIGGATVFEQKGRIYAAVAPYYFNVSTRTTSSTVNITDGASPLIEMVPEKPSETLSGLQVSRPVYCAVGRDMGVLGTFEEQDVDDVYNEGDVWLQSESRFVQSAVAYRGRSSMALVRSSDDTSRATVWLGNKMRMDSGDTLTLTGYVKTQNAGDFEISVRWMTGSDTFSQEVEYTEVASSHDWQRFSVDLIVPANADGVKIYYRHYPPESGEGLVFLDELALINWQSEQLTTDSLTPFNGPNDWRFVRCTDPVDGPLTLTIQRATYSLK